MKLILVLVFATLFVGCGSNTHRVQVQLDSFARGSAADAASGECPKLNSDQVTWYDESGKVIATSTLKGSAQESKRAQFCIYTATAQLPRAKFYTYRYRDYQSDALSYDTLNRNHWTVTLTYKADEPLR